MEVSAHFAPWRFWSIRYKYVFVHASKEPHEMRLLLTNRFWMLSYVPSIESDQSTHLRIIHTIHLSPCIQVFINDCAISQADLGFQYILLFTLSRADSYRTCIYFTQCLFNTFVCMYVFMYVNVQLNLCTSNVYV